MQSYSMEILVIIMSFCATSPMAQHNQIAVASRRLNVAWRRMIRVIVREMLPENAPLDAMDVADLRDVMGMD